MIMVLAYAAVGLVVGGLLNVLADDLPVRHRPNKPRCAACDAFRPVRAWLSTLAYLIDQGRCPNCSAPVPLRGVFVELGTASIFAYLYARYGLSGRTLLYSLYAAIFVLVTVTDLEHRLVLNAVILPAIGLALMAGPFTPDLGWRSMLVGGLIGFLSFYLLALLWPGAMGFGDVKLAAFIGLITGFPGVVVALVVTFLAGGVISLLLIVTRIRSLRDYIPYGPFLVIGGMVALLWGPAIVDAYMEPYRDEEPTTETSWDQIELSPSEIVLDWARFLSRTLGAVPYTSSRISLNSSKGMAVSVWVEETPKLLASRATLAAVVASGASKMCKKS